MVSILIIIILCFIFVILTSLFSRDKSGFDRKGIHKNGTRFDDNGYDIKGYDKNGFDRKGYNSDGFDKNGFNEEGYNIDGQSVNGKYNRFYDCRCYQTERYNKEGFLNPSIYPVIVTSHARERMYERIGCGRNVNTGKLVYEAYAYGKSARQLMKTSAAMLREIENRYENGIALIYKGYIYIFSEDNKLITMYKNEKVII